MVVQVCELDRLTYRYGNRKKTSELKFFLILAQVTDRKSGNRLENEVEMHAVTVSMSMSSHWLGLTMETQMFTKLTRYVNAISASNKTL